AGGRSPPHPNRLMRAPLLMVGCLLVALAAASALRERALPAAQAAPLRLLCGKERWSVKTFSDGDRFKVDLTRRYRTIKQLNALSRPASRPADGRTPDELKVYRVSATVMTTINEDDGDIHLALIGSDGSTLIAE